MLSLKPLSNASSFVGCAVQVPACRSQLHSCSHASLSDSTRTKDRVDHLRCWNSFRCRSGMPYRSASHPHSWKMGKLEIALLVFIGNDSVDDCRRIVLDPGAASTEKGSEACGRPCWLNLDHRYVPRIVVQSASHCGAELRPRSLNRRTGCFRLRRHQRQRHRYLPLSLRPRPSPSMPTNLHRILLLRMSCSTCPRLDAGIRFSKR